MDKRLVEKYLNNRCTPEEAREVLEWFQTPEGERYLEEQIDRDIRVSEEFRDFIEQPDIATEEVFAKIQRNKRSKRSHPSRTHYKNGLDVRKWMAIAAATILVLVSMLFLFQQNVITQMDQQEQADSKSEYPITLTTTAYRDKVIRLEDSTRITLKPNSRLKVLKGFSDDTRNVRLTGRAYFEVKSDSTKPFVVQTSHSYIRVLGTKFEVAAYPDRPEVKVKVDEGKVRFFSKDERLEPINLTKNESGILRYGPEQDTVKQNVESTTKRYQKPILVKHETAKIKDPQIKFLDTRLFVALNYLERRYNIDFEVSSDSLRYERFTIVTDESLLGAIEQIADSLNLTFEYNREENKMYLERK